MNTCWDNCKKAAATTGKQLHVSCLVLHASTRKSRYTILYREGLTQLLLSYLGWLMTKLRTGRHFTWWNFRRTFLPLNFTFSLDTFFYLCAGSSQFFLLKKQMFHHSKAEWEARRCKVRGGNPQGGCRSAHSMLLPPVNRGWIPVSSLTQKYHSRLCYTLIQTLIILELRSLLQRNLETGLSNEKTLFTVQQISKYSNWKSLFSMYAIHIQRMADYKLQEI